MTSLRSIVLSSVLLAACNPDAPTQPKAAPAEAAPVEAGKAPGSLPSKRLPPGDPHAEPPPGEEPLVMGVVPAATGTFDVELGGKLVHYPRLPRGQNRAIALPDGRVGRVSLGAAEGDAGLPQVRIIIEGLRPDQAQYPVTIGAAAKHAKTGPSLSMRYEVHEHRVYEIDPAKGAEMQVTLEGFEGATLRGRFEGKLAPTAAGLGDPIAISGKFAVELGLQGVQPGPAAPPG
jgi:hypothetical protein